MTEMKFALNVQRERRIPWLCPRSHRRHGSQWIRIFTLASVLGFALLFCSGAFGQSSQGFTGTVTDSTGAVISGAKVTIHDEKTGNDHETVTTSAGSYTVPFLDPGVYDVSAQAKGFKVVKKTSITLLTDQTSTVNFSLPTGNVVQTVTVNSSSDVLDYSTADRGDVIGQTRIKALPVEGANPFNLANLSAGVVNTINPADQDVANITTQDISVHGSGIEMNIDGMTDLSMTGAQNYAYDPPQDAVQEFKIVTNAFDAAEGRSPGGAIDMTLKRGTSKLHGDAYWIGRRGFMNANTSINDTNIALHGRKPSYNKPAQTENYFGFELGGPVVIPKVWHGKHKTFFMMAYSESKSIGGSTVSGSVPTQAMIGNGTQYPGEGDFSSLLTANGAAYNQPIYDPLSEAACTANNTDTGSYGSRDPHVCRYQFGYGPGGSPGPQGNPVQIGPANVIPADRLNPAALAILSWYAYPNLTPSPSTANDFNDNYTQNNPTTALYRNFLLRLDHTQGNNDRFDLELRLWTEFGTNINGSPRNNVNPKHPGINWAGYGAHYDSHYKDPSIQLGWTHTFSPNLVNSAKAAILITDQTDNTGPANGFNPTNLGFPSDLASANPTYFDRFPSINVGNYNVLGSIPGLERTDNELAIRDTVNYTHGEHSMHFGVYARPGQYSQRISNGSGNGVNLSVGKGWSQQWDTVVTGGATGISSSAGYSGNSVASMLLGTWDSGNATTQPENYYSSYYYALFFQDNWRIRPNLTLNLGVRWENMGGGETDRDNRQTSVFDTHSVNPISSMVNLGGLPISSQLLGGITFAGVNGNRRSPFKPTLYDFGPRFGFAYTVNPKTVVRGGMGVYYDDDANGGSGSAFTSPQTGYSSTTTYTGSNDGGATPLQNLSNPFPDLQTPQGNCGGNATQCLETNAGQSLSFIDPNYRPPLFLQTAFGFERQLSSHDTIEVSYTGARGYNMAYSNNIDNISAAAQAACDPERGGTATNCTSGSSTGTGGYIANPFQGLAPFAGSGSYYTAPTIQRINFTRPFPIFTGVTESDINGGKYWYNGVEATYNHRTSYGLDLHATYTYSKAMIANGFVDEINRIRSRTISGTDAPQQITASGVYFLPIGRGRSLFSGMNRFVDLLVGDWQVASIFTYRSGFPFNISGYEINKQANGGYILPRKRFWPGQANPLWSGKYASTNSYVQAFRPCVATRDPDSGAVTMEAYSIAAGCAAPNFISIGSYGVIPNIVYSGIRYQRVVTDDANISKNFQIPIGKSRKPLVFQLRMDAFNALNHVIQSSSGYDTSAGDSNFGTYQMGTSGGGNYPNRQIQITGRVTW